MKSVIKHRLLNAPKISRTHCYYQRPSVFDISCPICGSDGTFWSEYESHIWCYKCQKDIFIPTQFSGIFSGPIPIEIVHKLGISFDRVNIKTREVVKSKTRNGKASNKYNSTWVKDERLSEYLEAVENSFRSKKK